MYDAAIIGAGPAGSTLARLIAAHRRVLLVDRRPLAEPAEAYPARTVEKCCGGLLAPDAQEMLARQGLGLPREVLISPQLFVVRTLDLQSGLERYYQRHYINLDREKFDRWLVSLVPDSAERRFGCRFKSFERRQGGFRILLSQGESEVVEEARLLVGADGASSLLRKQGFPSSPAPRRYLAVQEWFAADEPQPYFSAIFDHEITDFYSWTIPKEGALVVGSALRAAPKAAERFDVLKAKLSKFGFRLDRSIRRRCGLLLRPMRVGQICTGGDGILLAGEAAGWISPSSAEGISYAFRSAIALADALLESPGDVSAAYGRNTAALRRNVLLKTLKSWFMCNPVLRRLILLSGIKSVAVRRATGQGGGASVEERTSPPGEATSSRC